MAYNEIDETTHDSSAVKTVIRVAVGVALALALIVVAILQHHAVKSNVAKNKLFSQYDRAVEMTLNGQYSEAESLLFEMKNKKDGYKDVDALIEYCRAHIAFDENRKAYNYAAFLNSKCSNLTSEQEEKFEDFKYEIICVDKTRKTTHEEEIKLSRNRYYPYTDMPEKLMQDTVLKSSLDGFYIDKSGDDGQGNCTERHNTYEFKAYKGKIYKVECTNGIVSSIDIKDLINDDTPDEATTNAPYTVESYKEYYNVKAFEYADDFYDYYKEDFDSYEEAEEYFEENHKNN